MKAPLLDKPTVERIVVTCMAKLRKAFMVLTGYDLMFEESRRDIKPLRLSKSNKQNGTLTEAYSALDKMQWHLNGERRGTKLAPVGHGRTGYLNHQS